MQQKCMLKQRASARAKRRYLLVIGSPAIIEQALLEYLGILGWSRACPVIEARTPEHSIIAVNREELVHVRAALALFHKPLELLRVSGTLKGLRQ